MPLGPTRGGRRRSPKRSWEPPGAPAPQARLLGAWRGGRTRLAVAEAPKWGSLTPTSQGRKVRRPWRVLNPGLWSRGTRGWRELLPLDPEGGKETHEAPQDTHTHLRIRVPVPPGEEPQVRGDGHRLQALTAGADVPTQCVQQAWSGARVKATRRALDSPPDGDLIQQDLGGMGFIPPQSS